MVESNTKVPFTLRVCVYVYNPFFAFASNCKQKCKKKTLVGTDLNTYEHVTYLFRAGRDTSIEGDGVVHIFASETMPILASEALLLENKKIEPLDL